MKAILKNILLISTILIITQGVFVAFFLLVGSIVFRDMYLTGFVAWIFSILALAVIAEVFGDKRISLTFHDHDNE